MSTPFHHFFFYVIAETRINGGNLIYILTTASMIKISPPSFIIIHHVIFQVNEFKFHAPEKQEK